ncbi:MAG: tetratricopeptide repeat protein [Desulfobacterales bacterium]|nr:tetratricopeptide repeat protein [Desulfobacterales bacterium]
MRTLTFVHISIVSVAVLFAMVAPAVANETPSLSPHALVPERQIVVRPGNPVPEWKSLWDKARDLAVAGKLDEAVGVYRALLAKKPNLEEGRWELARLRIHLEQWDKAAAQLEILVENAPLRPEYLNALGQVVWKLGQYDRAVDLFGKVAEKRPDDQAALAGLVEGLLKLDRKKEALPVLEQLHRLQPNNLGVRRYLALLSFEMGEYGKARSLLAGLAAQKDVDLEILLLAARVDDRLGQAASAAGYWQRVLERDPAQEEAHAWLARYFEKNNKPDRALVHLLALLKQRPGQDGLLVRVGDLYRRLGRFQKALAYYEEYLEKHPDDHEVLRRMARCYAASGAKDKALTALDRYFTVSPDSDPAQLKLAASLYDAAGRFHEAIPLYRRVLAVSPDDSQLLAALVNDLLAIGENEGALRIWKHLARVTPDQLPVYRDMARLLEKLGREGELYAILQRIHALDPEDDVVLGRLAVMAVARDDFAAAGKYFAALSRRGERSIEFIAAHGAYSEKTGRLGQALADYEEVLRSAPGRYDLRLAVIRLAGRLGLIGPVREQVAFFARRPAASFLPGELDRFKMTRADALGETGFFHQALVLYRGLITGSADLRLRQEAGLALARLFRGSGLFFEAEQALRQLLIVSIDQTPVLADLFELALESGRVADAEIWFAALVRTGQVQHRSLRFKEARLALARDKLRRAIQIGRQLVGDTGSRGADWSQQQLEEGLALGRAFLVAGSPDVAHEIVRSLPVSGESALAAAVLREQIQRHLGAGARTRNLAAENLRRAQQQGLRSLLALAGLYRDYRDPAGLSAVARIIASKVPQSLKVVFFLVKADEYQGRPVEALSRLRRVAARFPDNTRIHTGLARLFFITGDYVAAAAQCETILTVDPGRPDILLLKARILWARDQWAKAITVYRQFLAPPVDSILAQQARASGLPLSLPPNRTIWDRILLSKGTIPRVTEVVMAPERALNQADEVTMEITRLAAPWYARYRWQELFASELSARRAVRRREYHRAAKRYEALVAEYGKQPSLRFDLAGIYSRVGKLGEEAAIYEEMLADTPFYPGLADAAQRNRLKRRPLVSFSSGQQEDEGWDDYLAIKRTWLETSLWLSPRAQDEAEVTVARVRYQSRDNARGLWSRRARFSYRAGLRPGLVLQCSGGVNDFDDGQGGVVVFSCGLDGEIGDKVRVHLGFNRDLVDDTIAGLTRNLTRNDTSAGLSVDILPALMVGGDYGITDFSDGNQKKAYNVWSSYIVFAEPTLLTLTYNYDFQDTVQGANPGGPVTADGFAVNDHPYWAPQDYWQNRFTLAFKQQLSVDTLARKAPRYYTLEYTLGHDSRGYDLHEFQGGFCVEWTPHFLIKASAGLFHTEGARSRNIYLSAVYRW